MDKTVWDVVKRRAREEPWVPLGLLSLSLFPPFSIFLV